MNIKIATAIREAFGPDTFVYECNTAAEIAAYAKLNTMSPAYFAKTQLEAEGILHEHDSAEAYTRWENEREAIKGRLREICDFEPEEK